MKSVRKALFVLYFVGMNEGTAKKPIRLFIIIIILILSSELLVAQVVEVDFNRVWIEMCVTPCIKGGMTVHSIFQDSQGFLWVGAFDFLIRYDGFECVIYRRNASDPDSLFGTAFSSICEDTDGSLWISSDGALSRFDRERQTFTNYRNNEEQPGSLINNTVNTVYVDHSGNLWVGTDGGLCLYDRDSDGFVGFVNDPDDPTSLSHNRITDILEDSRYNLWVATYGGGLNRFDRRTGGFVHLRHDPENPESLSDDRVWSLAEVSDELWVGTDGGGLNRFERERNIFIRYTHDPDDSRSLSSDRGVEVVPAGKRSLWVGTEQGLCYLEMGREEFVRFKSDPDDYRRLDDNRLRSLYQDRSGVLWIGTVRGLHRADRKRQHFRYYLRGDKVMGICEDARGVLWVGTRRGLVRLDRETDELFRYRADPSKPNSLSSDSISSVYIDSTGTLWVGTLEGLDRFDPKTMGFLHYRPDPDNANSLSHVEVTAIIEDSRGELWFGTYGGGLNLFNPDGNDFIHFPYGSKDTLGLGDPMVTQLYEDSGGTLWISTFGTLFRSDRKNRQFINYGYGAGEPKNMYQSSGKGICQDGFGRMWIASDKHLHLYDPKKDTLILVDRPDFVDSNLYGIFVDRQDHLWIMTDYRLTRWDPESDASRTYGPNDGLDCLPFIWLGGVFASPSGEVFLGGQNGMVSFFPEQLQSDYQPTVVLTSLQISDRKIQSDRTKSTQKNIELSSHDSQLRFEFLAHDFSIPGENQYAYLMEGYDEDWNYAGTNRVAEYSNLPAGQYLFTVKATNRDGVWNAEPNWLSINIQVQSSLFKSLWALGLYIVLAAAAAVGVIVIYRRLQSRTAEPTGNKRTVSVATTTFHIHTPRYELFLIGSPRLMRDGFLQKIGRKKAFALLVYLALNKGSVQHEFLAELLWPNNIKNRKNLRTTIACLNSDLAEQLVRRNDTLVQLDHEIGLFTDANEIERLVEAFKQSMRGSAPSFHLLEEAAELLKGRFMDGFYLKGCPDFENWLVLEENRIEQISRFALSTLIKRYELLKEYEQATTLTRRLIDLDPTDEQTHRILIRLYAEAGQKQLALRQYIACERILESELGLEPDGETKALLHSIKTGV